MLIYALNVIYYLPPHSYTFSEPSSLPVSWASGKCRRRRLCCRLYTQPFTCTSHRFLHLAMSKRRRTSEYATKHPRIDQHFGRIVRPPPGAVQNTPSFPLSRAQSCIYRMIVEDGLNVFITGPAGALSTHRHITAANQLSTGTGKSAVLQAVSVALRKAHSTHPDAVAVTAATPISALTVNGEPHLLTPGCSTHA